MNARTPDPPLDAGTAVRLSFDTGPKSVGYVLAVLDKVRVQVEFPSESGSSEGTFIDGPATVFVAPTAILVAVCEWVETYADEWGMACSEPGVPTSYDVPCLFDATTSSLVGDDEDGEPVSMNFCPEHGQLAATEWLAHSLTTR